jgi:hypothetical protein
MHDPDNPNTTGEQLWSRQDEENLLLEVSENRRLQRLGIDLNAVGIAGRRERAMKTKKPNNHLP